MVTNSRLLVPLPTLSALTGVAFGGPSTPTPRSTKTISLEAGVILAGDFSYSKQVHHPRGVCFPAGVQNTHIECLHIPQGIRSCEYQTMLLER